MLFNRMFIQTSDTHYYNARSALALFNLSSFQTSRPAPQLDKGLRGAQITLGGRGATLSESL